MSIPPDVVAFLESRLRSGNEKIPVIGIRSGTNPGGPGSRLSARYVAPPGHVRGRAVRFIPSKLVTYP